MSCTVAAHKHIEVTAPAPDIVRVLATADAYLRDREQAPRPSVFARFGRSVWAFLKAVAETRAHQEMRAEADRIQASRPELAAQLRRAARGQWM